MFYDYVCFVTIIVPWKVQYTDSHTPLVEAIEHLHILSADSFYKNLKLICSGLQHRIRTQTYPALLWCQGTLCLVLKDPVSRKYIQLGLNIIIQLQQNLHSLYWEREQVSLIWRMICIRGPII